MKKYKIESKTLFINVEIPVEIGEVKLTGVVQIIYCGDVSPSGLPTYDKEIVDYYNVTFRGVSLKDTKPVKTFYNEVGLNLDTIITSTIDEILTDNEIIEILSNVKI